jgi:hypothetical protein
MCGGRDADPHPTATQGLRPGLEHKSTALQTHIDCWPRGLAFKSLRRVGLCFSADFRIRYS